MSKFVLQKKLEGYKKELHSSSDVASRILEKQGVKIGFVYLKSMTDQELFSNAIYQAIQNYKEKVDMTSLQDKIIRGNDVKEIKEEEVVENILKGSIIIMIEGEKKILAVDLLKFPTRTPSEPPTSPVIQGPREGFVEDIKTNITLLRRRLHSKDLVFKSLNIGKYSNTQVMVSYIEGIADKKIVDDVIKKLKKIDIGGVVDSYYILSFLQRRPDSLFKQVGNTEKPDIVAAKMLEGRVAIIVDNSPIVLTVPFVLLEEMQSSNDYYTNHHYSSFVRIIRLLGLLVAILSPGLYLALELHHYNVLPLNFLITIADTTQGLPFTPFIEILFIFILFQMLYEVSLRLPSYLGLATSVVGALILGDTGVKAGLISPPGVIVVALAKIALYTIPEQSAQISILQVIFIVIGGTLGLAGIVTGLVYFTNYLNGLDSFNTPYLAPYSPRIPNDLKDGIFKSSVTEMKTRPKSIKNTNKVRLK